MSYDVECPYCGKGQEINHDEGYGYDENEIHNQECDDCNKIFTYRTSIVYYYESYKADCLNGGEHQWERTHTYPKEFTKMECKICSERRNPTPNELSKILTNIK
jgi:hypothetical protein